MLVGCGSNAAPEPTASSAPTPSVSTPSPSVSVSSPSATSSSTTTSDTAQEFVDSFRAKVAASDFTPPKGVSAEGAEKYMADLADDRLVGAGKYACQTRDDGLTKDGFVQLLLKNKGTEEGFKPLLPLLWDEATTKLCRKN